MLLVRQHPSLFFAYETQTGGGWGSCSSKQGSSWLVYWLSYFFQVGGHSFCPWQLWCVLSVRHVPFLWCWSLFLFCLLVHRCLNAGLRHYIHLWNHILDTNCIQQVLFFSLWLFWRGLLHFISLSVHCHVMMMAIPLGVRGVISACCTCIAYPVSFKTFSRRMKWVAYDCQ